MSQLPPSTTIRSPLNWAIAVILVIIGLVAIQYPSLIGSRESAATLAGALFGAAAIFMGAAINRWDQHIKDKEDIEEKQRRIHIALTTELVGICINHIESTKFFREATNSLSSGTVPPTSIDFDRYLPAEPFVYQALLPQITSLPEIEIDALATFYGNLERTKRELLKCKESGSMLGLLNAGRLANCFEHDCTTASKLITLFAPARKIQNEREQPILLSELLRLTANNSTNITSH